MKMLKIVCQGNIAQDVQDTILNNSISFFIVAKSKLLHWTCIILSIPCCANFNTLLFMIIQASLRSEELCQDNFKVFVHVVVHSHFYFPSIFSHSLISRPHESPGIPWIFEFEIESPGDSRTFDFKFENQGIPAPDFREAGIFI